MALRTLTFLALVALMGCGPKGPTPDADAGPYITGFEPPAVASGYTRFVTPAITGITAGENQIWCQWLAAPATKDQDVVNVTALQSKFGHHVVLFATSEQQPVGTSRPCTGTDMETVRFLGGFGAEGSNGIFQQFPPDTVLRLPAGWGLMANIHFVNVSSDTIDGQAVLDAEFTDPTPTHHVAGFFSNGSDQFTIPAGQPLTLDVNCPVKQELDFFMVADHMHTLGANVYTEVIRADGTSQMMVQDTTWSSDLEFNPTFSMYLSPNLFSVYPGDTVHTHCDWNNSGSTDVSFPGEMCEGLGFFLPPPDGGTSAGEVDCFNGSW